MRKPNSTKTMFLVELVLPPGMSSTNMCFHIRDAIQAEPGIHHPSDAIFNLDPNTVTVKNAHKVLTGIEAQLTALRKARGPANEP